MIDLILGTAGHIDHGKTALIRALTGVDTDRLPEEKRRGISIELGFAELTLDCVRLGIVDVPGHERFVRQMLAGATGMDLAMLVVAADDSVKPQTREHMAVLRLLDLKAGVVVLTKCDLAEPDWVDLVEQEVRELIAGSFLESAPLIRTSTVSGQGILELRCALQSAAMRAYESMAPGQRDATGRPFRMAVDRAFSLAGHGTVVTGSVASGSVTVGDTLELHPMGALVRVRSLHNHDRAVESVHRGQRAAINLASVNLGDLHRGCDLATPGFLRPSQLVTVDLQLISDLKWTLKDRSRVRLHLGTMSTLATVRFLDTTRLRPGERANAQLYLAESVTCTWNQPFVIRRESPMDTVGGGRILVPIATRIRRCTSDDQAALGQLMHVPAHEEETHHDNEIAKRFCAAVHFVGEAPTLPLDAMRMAGDVDLDQAVHAGLQSGQLVRLAAGNGAPIVVHRHCVGTIAETLLARLQFLHDRQPLAAAFEYSALASGLQYLGQDELLRAVVKWLQREGRIAVVGSTVALANRPQALTSSQSRMFASLVTRLQGAGIEPPLVPELQKLFPTHAKEVLALLELGVAQGQLIRISKELFVHASVEHEIRDRLLIAFASKSALTVSEIRDLLATSRKYAVPICEYLDRIQFTQRMGDQRVLTSRSVASEQSAP